MTRILVVEDEPGIALGLEDDLTLEGYQVEVLADGAAVSKRVREQSFDVILLDVMLPGKDGFEICRELRRTGVTTPILMLTARAQESEKVLGLEVGADDYVTKPFSARELRARIAALLRRSQGAMPAIVQIGDVDVDFSRAELRRGSDVTPLTPLEFRVLQTFIRARGRIVTREQLITDAWGPNTFVSDRVVDNHIGSLRRKLEPDAEEPRYLRNVRGLGYALKADEDLTRAGALTGDSVASLPAKERVMSRHRLVLIIVLFGACAAAGLGLGATTQAASSGEKLLAAAKHKARDDGDLPGAIEMYKQVVATAGADKLLAAEALFGMAACYDKLGRPEANALYERIVANYGTSRAAAAARMKLADGQKTLGLTVRQVWSETGDAVSSDGKYMTTTNWDTGDLAIHEFSSGRTSNVTEVGKWDGSFAQGGLPSPDGKQIAYSWYAAANQQETLRLIGRDGKGGRILHKPEEANASVWPVAWSPDGRVVYALVDKLTSPVPVTPRRMSRRLTAFPLNGQPARVLKQLETTGAAQMEPALSPDGRTLAYSTVTTPGTRDRDIRLLSLESGQETTLVEHPADDAVAGWFPTGDRLLFISTRGGTRGLWSVAISGGKPLGEPESVKPDVGPMASRGFTRNGDFYYGISTAEVDVYLGSLASASGASNRLERLPSRVIGMKLQAVWSHDGDRLVYLRPDPSAERAAFTSELAIHTISTGAVRILRLALQQFQNPAWMPDGRAMVVNGRDLDGKQGLFFVNADNGQLTPIVTRGAGPENDIQRGNPAVSPDGKKIYFSWAAPGQAGVGGLGVRDVATGAETRITKSPVRALALSPDGRWFVIAEAAAGVANGTLSVVAVDGGETRRIGAGAPAEWTFAFTWMPDSKSVMAIHRTDKGNEFWVLPTDGGPPRNTGIVWKDDVNRVSVNRDGRLAVSTRHQRSETWVMQNLPHVRK